MQLIIEPGGAVRCIYAEEIDLAALGSPAITRAIPRRARPAGTLVGRSVARGRPDARAVPDHRSEALAAEHAWLETNWLGRTGGQ